MTVNREGRMEEREDSPIVVTEENFGELLIAGLKEVLAEKRGELEPARRVVRRTKAGGYYIRSGE